ncbi:MAG: S41 family peptidase [Bacteroidota bacterium]
MKNIYLIFLLLSSSSFSQTTKISDKNLFTLGKVWGLMKYYQPMVSQGKIDWDSVLLVTLKKNENEKQIPDQVIAEWFEIVSKTIPAHIAPNPFKCDSITKRNYNFDWINTDARINNINRTKLLALIQNPTNIGMYYSNSDPTGTRFSALNEKTYPVSSNHLKLLELYRVWNAIAYFYPYKYLLDHNWDSILKKYIPLFKHVTTEETYKIAITQLAAEIQDTHVSLKKSYYYDIFGAYTAPFTFQLTDNGALVTKIKNSTVANPSGIEVGDFITQIDGIKINKIVSKNSKLVPASNPSVIYREAYNYLFSGPESTFTIKGINSKGASFKKSVLRVKRQFETEWDKDGIPEYHLSYKGKSYEYLRWDSTKNRINPIFELDNKAYIEFSTLQANEIDSLMKKYKDAKGIVFDLRGYNNAGYLLKVFDYLFSSPQNFGIKTHADFNEPGKFCFEDYIISETYKYIGIENPKPYKGRVIVLINEYTQSAAELWAMIFKKIPNVVFVGSQTAGADGNITNIPLTDGNKLSFSGLGIYYVDGAETQRIGIKPDVLVRPTKDSMRKKEDLLLSTAFELIDSTK